jgi:hypothetical protein
MVPTVVALRERLDQICRQELEAFRSEVGPFPKDQDDMLLALTSRITLQIAGALAREIREIPEKTQQEHMTEAVERLFHLKHEEIELVSTPLVS